MKKVRIALACFLGCVLSIEPTLVQAVSPSRLSGHAIKKPHSRDNVSVAKQATGKKLARASKRVVLKKAAMMAVAASAATTATVAYAAPHNTSSIDRFSSDNGGIVPIGLQSHAVLVMDQLSGEVLYGRNTDVVLPIASITKLMTSLVLLEDYNNLDLNESITISDQETHLAKSSKSRLQPGMTFTRAELIVLALMSSENRAAYALGRSAPGGLTAFVDKMNRKAKSLGMAGSYFVEPTGLSSDNVSTAQDLAKLVSAAYKVPLIRDSSTTASRVVMLGHRPAQFNNTNALVRAGQWDIGVSKTGYISEAGRCLVMQARLASRPVIMVLLDSNGKYTRVADAQRIRRWIEGQSGGHHQAS